MHHNRTWKGPRLRWLAFSTAFAAAGTAAFLHWGPEELPRAGSIVGEKPTAVPWPSVARAQARAAEPPSLASIAEAATQSVVSVSSTLARREPAAGPFDDPRFRYFGSPERQARGLGSGVIVAKDGTVLTNSHVVDKASEIMVTLPDGREFKAEVRGSDPKSDLAVLKLQGDFGDLKPIEMGDSKRLRLGDVVLAIGNPFGLGQTVTMGIVSATSRAGMGIVDYEDFIQTDAAINPGNSGGAMVNMEGKLVGINTAILSRSGGYQGIGFAIPTAMAQPIMKSILEHGKVVRGWLGVGIQDIDADLQQALGLEERKGALVSALTAGGPAASAGLERGDVVVEFAGQPVASATAFRNRVAAAAPGSHQKLVVIRDGQRIQLEARLGTLPHRET
ncbi:MAG TPA: trypsin-like peptidase domain-containing protein [Polyangiaceae bacterium]